MEPPRQVTERAIPAAAWQSEGTHAHAARALRLETLADGGRRSAWTTRTGCSARPCGHTGTSARHLIIGRAGRPGCLIASKRTGPRPRHDAGWVFGGF